MSRTCDQFERAKRADMREYRPPAACIHKFESCIVHQKETVTRRGGCLLFAENAGLELVTNLSPRLRGRISMLTGRSPASTSSSLVSSTASEITPHGSKKAGAKASAFFLICAPCLLLPESDPLRWALIRIGQAFLVDAALRAAKIRFAQIHGRGRCAPSHALPKGFLSTNSKISRTCDPSNSLLLFPLF